MLEISFIVRDHSQVIRNIGTYERIAKQTKYCEYKVGTG